MSDDIEALRRSLASLRQEHQRIVAQMRRDQDRFQDIARSAWRVQEEERRRLARELHDGIGQNLTALKNDLARLVKEGELADWQTRVQSALDTCADCLADTREMSRLLRPPVLDDLGLQAALSQLGRSMTERTGIEIEVVIRDVPETLPPDLSSLVYRLVQEGLTNAVKHAGADSILIRVAGGPGRLELIMIDDGRGFDVEATRQRGEGFGLSAMAERAALFGGHVELDSSPGTGTRLRVRIPIRTGRMDGAAGDTT